VIVVASVSCIYGLGSPEDYKSMMVGLSVGEIIDRDAVLTKLVDMRYERERQPIRNAASSASAAIQSRSGPLRGIRLPN